jgi:FG-GAP-like repeat/RTX calcium-binding nonapeptide repeat (4 copies)
MAIDFSQVTVTTFLPSNRGQRPFTKAERDEIIDVMQNAYDDAPIALTQDADAVTRKMFEEWIISKGKQIRVKFLEGKFQENKGVIEIDPNYVKKGSYIGVYGTAIRSTFEDAFLHELGHALKDYDDDWKNYQGQVFNQRGYTGENVEFVNIIYKELGIPLNLSYPASDYTEKIIKPGYEYTNGTKIDAALALGTKELPTKTFWNSTQLGNSNDLLIGGLSNDTLISGPGNDFLFGSLGNDILDGGDGNNDTGVYYGLRKNYSIKQESNGTWTVQGITGLGKNAGVDKLKNIEFLEFDDPDPNKPGKKKRWALDATFKQDGKLQKSVALVFDTTKNLVLPSLTNPIPKIVSSLDNSKTLATSILNSVFADPDKDVEIGIVRFNDKTIGNSAQLALQFTKQADFTARKTAALTAINNLTATDGGDIAETPFDGLLVALNELQWRDGGTHQIFLFTDAPAKDYALAEQVTALARSIGSTIASTATATLAGGAVDTFNLVSSSLDGITDPNATQVQIFTIFTGTADADTTPLAAISNDNDGALLTGSTNDELLQQILATFNPPPVSPAVNLLPSNDFNGDGKSDILWRNTDGSIAIWELDGTKVTPKSVSSLTADWTIAGTGDFNGDFNTDILFRNTNGTVVTWQLDSSSITSTSVIGTAPLDWTIAGTGDFNGDGESDILWRNTNGNIATWELNDATLTTSSVIGAVTPDWKIAGTDDFNGDGESDILWRNDNGNIALWTMDGGAVLASAVIGAVTPDWKIAGTGDFNGDGESDLLWRNTNGNVAEWQINDGAVTAAAIIGSAPNDWKIAGTDDFNGDGKVDILWRNDLGTVATWQLDGTKILSAGLTSIPSAAPSWKIAAPIL